MATTRRRDRRPAHGQNRPNQSDQPVQLKQPVSGSLLRRSPALLLCLAAILIAAAAAANFAYRKAHHSLVPSPAHSDRSVRERNLVKSDIEFEEILAEHGRFCENRSHRNFPNLVLAYVTPWNSKGYEMAKLFSSKLTHVSPVWYELKSDGKKLILEGRHNADVDWISQVRLSGNSLVLPRVVLEVYPPEFLQKIELRREAINLIVTECKDIGYDGIVLESWSRWAAYGILQDPHMRNVGLEFLKELGDALHSVNSRVNASHQLELVYVIPPPRSQKLTEYDFRPEDLQQLSDVVDGLSLMTYDFSGPQSPGPNAPLEWILFSLQQLLGGVSSNARGLGRKIFLGINFYGNDFTLSQGAGGGAITGRDYLSLLEKHRPAVQWEERSAEHFFFYSSNNEKHIVFYPSLMSISKRLDVAQEWGTGLSIWEIGQGLDCYFDLL